MNHDAPCPPPHGIPRPERPAHTAAVLFIYKDFKQKPDADLSHIGLGVSASHMARLLADQGVQTDVVGIWNPDDIAPCLQNRPSLTHVVIEAPWVPLPTMHQLLRDFPQILFVIRCHSQLAFLQVDPRAVSLLRAYLAMQRGGQKVKVAGNSRRFTEAFEYLYGPCTFLPNGYYLDQKVVRHRRHEPGTTLRIGSFGATRVLKNHLTAAAAAIIAAKQMGRHLEFFISTGRSEGAGPTLQALEEMFEGLPTARLVAEGWRSWPDFVTLAESMDALMQLSFTETFNIVTADGVAHGVPSVVSPAIEWVPAAWKVDPDDAVAAATTLRHLLHDHRAPQEGLAALHSYNHASVCTWMAFLDHDPRARHRLFAE